MSERFDPYLGSGIKRDDALNFLWEYALGKAGLSPKAPRSDVPNPNTPYRGTSGNYVGTDTSKVGGNNRNIDLELNPNINSEYVGVNPDEQNVVVHDGQHYVIDKDQRLVGDQVLSKDTPVFGQGKARVGRGILDFITGNKWDFDKRDSATNVIDAQTTRPKSQTEKLLDQEETKRVIEEQNKDSNQAKKTEALNDAMKTAEHQAAVDLNYMKQLYPVAQAAAWDATQRGLYGDKYSASAAQRRLGESAAAEARMYAAVAQQANAAANMRGRFTGKNISFG